MKKQTKKQLAEFNNELKEILSFYNATQVNESTYTLDSELIGKLTIRLDQTVSSVYSVMAEFEDTDKAINFFDVKPYNGKMQSHEFNDIRGPYFLDSLLDNYIQIIEREGYSLV